MTVQPTFHWQFNEREGSITKDSINGVEGKLNSRVSWEEHGRMGNAIKLDGGSHINFGNAVGQFGTSDFTIAFGMKILALNGESDADIIGNRVRPSTSRNIDNNDLIKELHDNWFTVRLHDKKLWFQVDEDKNGTHMIRAISDRLPLFEDDKWHHIAAVREGRTLKVYLDGALVAQGTSNTGVANINNGIDLKLGNWNSGTPTARYEDLRIYHSALNAT